MDSNDTLPEHMQCTLPGCPGALAQRQARVKSSLVHCCKYRFQGLMLPSAECTMSACTC